MTLEAFSGFPRLALSSMPFTGSSKTILMCSVIKCEEGGLPQVHFTQCPKVCIQLTQYQLDGQEYSNSKCPINCVVIFWRPKGTYCFH